jgi:hypothetical protein
MSSRAENDGNGISDYLEVEANSASKPNHAASYTSDNSLTESLLDADDLSAIPLKVNNSKYMTSFLFINVILGTALRSLCSLQ